MQMQQVPRSQFIEGLRYFLVLEIFSNYDVAQL